MEHIGIQASKQWQQQQVFIPFSAGQFVIIIGCSFDFMCFILTVFVQNPLNF
jgi:hypothetical protein